MSLLSRERLIVSLSPERLSALRLAGRWRRRLLDEYSTLLPDSGNPPWRASLEALEMLLDDPAWGGRQLTVILSSHFVHYAILPGGKVLNASEQNDLAQLIFRNIFGELARDWEFRISPLGDQPCVACGVPQALLAGLDTACAGRARLQAIQPGLMTVFNRVRPTIDRQSGTLALVESGRITLANIAAGQWQSISSRVWPGPALAALLSETQGLSSHSMGGHLWLCDLTGQAVPPSTPDWQLERLITGPAAAASLAAWGNA